MAYNQAFPPTPPDATELKTLPAGTQAKATANGSYFEQSGRLFRPLFNYISTNDIQMTVPVEARIEDAAMSFWVDPADLTKVRPPGKGVEIVTLPERQVAAQGYRGGYSRENFEKVRTRLLAWVESRTDVEAAGPAYAVYWNGPFTPWFIKHFEVHVPVRPKR